MDRAIDPRFVTEHLAQAAERLRAQRVDGLLVYAPANIRGFTGTPLGPSDRLVCAWITRSGQSVLICPRFEAPEPTTLSPGVSVRTWDEHENPFAIAADSAGELGIAAGTLLLDGETSLTTRRGLEAALPRATLREDGGIIAAVRAIKSAGECDTIAAACGRVGRLYGEIGRRLRAGECEQALARDAAAALGDGELSQGLPMVQGGPNAAVPHRAPGERALCEGDCVVVDFVLRIEGYHGDMTRTFVVGRPSEKMRSAYRAVRAAQRAALAAIRPGMTCESIDAAARRAIDEAGFGRAFFHRTGHGIGLDCHEPPYLVAGNTTRLSPGHCVTVEPGIYLPGEFGIRIEDCAVVTPEGHRVLSAGVPTDVSKALEG